MEIKELMRELTLWGLPVTAFYDGERNELAIDLDTQAKSHLYLYEDGTVRGRYNYENKIDFESDFMRQLAFEFLRALCGRDYGNERWFEILKKYDIKWNTLSLNS